MATTTYLWASVHSLGLSGQKQALTITAMTAEADEQLKQFHVIMGLQAYRRDILEEEWGYLLD